MEKKIVTQSVGSDGLICAHPKVGYFQECGAYNTDYCLHECVFRAVDDVNVDYTNYSSK
jgi:hypothetical protein